jgi:hypothetical protein
LCRFRVESVNVFVLPRFDLCHKHIFFIMCKNKKRCYNDLLHFWTRKHNLVSFFGWIVFWQYNSIIVFLYILFFRRKC